MVAVYSESGTGRRFLLLHNVKKQLDEAGDWAWGSPSGCREPGEDIATTAARELWEETGIRAEPVPVVTSDINWAVFHLEVPWGTPIRLAPDEHNAYEWCTLDEATVRIQPERQALSFRLAVAALR